MRFISFFVRKIVFPLACCLLASCFGEKKSKRSIRVYIQDAKTERPIEGAEVWKDHIPIGKIDSGVLVLSHDQRERVRGVSIRHKDYMPEVLHSMQKCTKKGKKEGNFCVSLKRYPAYSGASEPKAGGRDPIEELILSTLKPRQEGESPGHGDGSSRLDIPQETWELDLPGSLELDLSSAIDTLESYHLFKKLEDSPSYWPIEQAKQKEVTEVPFVEEVVEPDASSGSQEAPGQREKSLVIANSQGPLEGGEMVVYSSDTGRFWAFEPSDASGHIFYRNRLGNYGNQVLIAHPCCRPLVRPIKYILNKREVRLRKGGDYATIAFQRCENELHSHFEIFNERGRKLFHGDDYAMAVLPLKQGSLFYNVRGYGGLTELKGVKKGRVTWINRQGECRQRVGVQFLRQEQMSVAARRSLRAFKAKFVNDKEIIPVMPNTLKTLLSRHSMPGLSELKSWQKTSLTLLLDRLLRVAVDGKTIDYREINPHGKVVGRAEVSIEANEYPELAGEKLFKIMRERRNLGEKAMGGGSLQSPL